MFRGGYTRAEKYLQDEYINVKNLRSKSRRFEKFVQSKASFCLFSTISIDSNEKPTQNQRWPIFQNYCQHFCLFSPRLKLQTQLKLCLISINVFWKDFKYKQVMSPEQFWSSGLVVKTLGSQSRGPVFKTSGWPQGRLSLSSIRVR